MMPEMSCETRYDLSESFRELFSCSLDIARQRNHLARLIIPIETECRSRRGSTQTNRYNDDDDDDDSDDDASDQLAAVSPPFFFHSRI